ncbi:Diguanylate cyclase DosC [Caloramator mitchellensis]|uniref:Diguanylate cyclase DosC n=1 Tax=Caloramator mitchellensis TaxID=908809 RepID=A0A0R3K1W9_CALMK|nr:diguanylate cyclase [Caloramator mitchellensis]KRQ87260.1 Diguanylate cyclase DosC [Caloramator mitchellensis]
MKIINNRFRIIKKNYQNQIITSYRVADLKSSHRTINLNILNSDSMDKKLINYCIEEFIMLSNIKNDNIIKLHNFYVIESIDNGQIKDKTYFFTSDRVENQVSFNMIEKLSLQSKIELFIKLCRTINYLHLIGYNYLYLNLLNINLINREGDLDIVINDILTSKINDKLYSSKKGNLLFKAPEVIKSDEVTNQSDIYSLGVMLIAFLLGRLKFTNIEEGIQFLYGLNKQIPSGLINIIKTMTRENPDDRFENINAVIKELNCVFNSNFNAIDLENLGKLNDKIKICDRKSEIEKILDGYKRGAKCAIVSGETGIGKSRLLKELEFKFKINNIESFSFFGNYETQSKKVVSDIIKQMFINTNEDLIRQFENDFVSILPELKSNNINEFTYDEKTKIRLLNSFYRFIKQRFGSKKIVLIIDDLNEIDSFTMDLALDLVNSDLNEQIFFVISYKEEKSTDKKFKDLLYTIKQKDRTISINLEGLSEDATAEMIKCKLFMSYTPKLFANKIYSITMGNPLFIEELLKDLYIRKILYVNPISGIWSSQYDDNYDNMILPTTVEQAILSQIRGLDEMQMNILEIIAMFETSASLEILKNTINLDADTLTRVLLQLESTGVIVFKISDEGYVYDFRNKLLKKIIYSKIDENKKKFLHKKVAEIIEKYADDFISFALNDELIYHLEKYGDKEKAAKFCIKNAELMKQFKNMNDAINYFEKAISLFDEKIEDEVKLNTFFETALLYYQTGNIQKALHYYKLVLNISLFLENYKDAIDALNFIVEISLNKNELESAQINLRKIEEIINEKEKDYLKGYLEYRYNLAIYYRELNDFSKVDEIARESLKLINDEDYRSRGKFIKLLGDICLFKSMPDEALKYYEKSLSCFDKARNKVGMMTVLNNISIIYSDYYQDYEVSLKYLKDMLIISSAENSLTIKALSLLNIASIYYLRFDYEKSLKYFLEALAISESLEFEVYVFYIYCYLIGVYLRLGQVKSSYDYYLKTKEEIEKYPNQGKYESLYYYFSGELFYYLGDFERAKSNLERVVEIYNQDYIKTKWDAEILIEIINIKMFREEKILKSAITKILDISANYQNKFEKLNIYYNLLINCHKIADENTKNLILNLINNNDLNDVPKIIRIKLDYLKHVLKVNKGQLKQIELLLKESKENRLKQLYWRLSVLLGDTYYDEGNIFMALNHYANAIQQISSIVSEIPIEYKRSFVIAKNALKPLCKIYEIKGDYIALKETCIEQLSDKTIDEMLSYKHVKNVLYDKHLINNTRRIIRNELKINIKSFEDLIGKLILNPLVDLDLISKYLAYVTLATRCLIVSETNELEILASSNENKQLPDDLTIFNTVKQIEKPVFSTDTVTKDNSIYSYACIPLVKRNFKDRKRISTYDIKRVLGYIFIESDKIINYINEESIQECIKFSNIVLELIDKNNIINSSIFDKLTRAYTRKFFDDAIEEHIQNAENSNGYFSIIMIDIDNFKKLNDKFGHQTGDKILKQLGNVVRETIRKNDLFCRYGGEEFIIILPDTKKNEAYILAERIRNKIENTVMLFNKSITVSMGVSTFPEDAEWKDELIEKADKALYAAKENGKNRVEIWREDFENKGRVTNKLSGLLTGNEVKDSAKILYLIELSELSKANIDTLNLIYYLLGILLESTESKYAGYLKVKNNKIIESYWRKAFIDGWIGFNYYNMNLINRTISEKEGRFLIDWEEYFEYDQIKNIPVFYSVMLVPVIKRQEILGVIYLATSSNEKEYKFEDFNYVSILSNIFSALI